VKKKWAGKVQAAYIRAFTNKRENFAAIMLARWARMYAADTKDHQLRELVLLNLEDQILSAAERKDGRFFRVFAKHLEQEKHPCSIRLWVWDKHRPGPNDKGINLQARSVDSRGEGQWTVQRCKGCDNRKATPAHRQGVRLSVDKFSLISSGGHRLKKMSLSIF